MRTMVKAPELRVGMLMTAPFFGKISGVSRVGTDIWLKVGDRTHLLHQADVEVCNAVRVRDLKVGMRLLFGMAPEGAVVKTLRPSCVYGGAMAIEMLSPDGDTLKFIYPNDRLVILVGDAPDHMDDAEDDLEIGDPSQLSLALDKAASLSPAASMRMLASLRLGARVKQTIPLKLARVIEKLAEVAKNIGQEIATQNAAQKAVGDKIVSEVVDRLKPHALTENTTFFVQSDNSIRAVPWSGQNFDNNTPIHGKFFVEAAGKDRERLNEFIGPIQQKVARLPIPSKLMPESGIGLQKINASPRWWLGEKPVQRERMGRRR